MWEFYMVDARMIQILILVLKQKEREELVGNCNSIFY